MEMWRRASEKSCPTSVQSPSRWRRDAEPLRSLSLLLFKARHNGDVTQSHKEFLAYFRSKPVTMEMWSRATSKSLSCHVQSPFKARRDAVCAKALKCQRVSDETLVSSHDARKPCRDAKTKICAIKIRSLAHLAYLFPIAFKQALGVFGEEDREILGSRILQDVLPSFTLVSPSEDF